MDTCVGVTMKIILCTPSLYNSNPIFSTCFIYNVIFSEKFSLTNDFVNA